MDTSSPGPLCEQLGISGEILVLDTIGLMPAIDHSKITKGVKLELNQFRKSNNLSWNHFTRMDDCTVFEIHLAFIISD